MPKLFNNPSDVFEQQLDDLFVRKPESETDMLFKVLSLILYKNIHNRDIQDLYNSLDLESFSRVVTLFDGRTVKFPTREELKDALTLALCYYYKEIEGMDWDQIKATLPFEVSSFSYGTKIKSLDRYVYNQIGKIFKEMS
jgi:hypothetical protein